MGDKAMHDGAEIMRMEALSMTVTNALRWGRNLNPALLSELMNKSGVKNSNVTAKDIDDLTTYRKEAFLKWRYSAGAHYTSKHMMSPSYSKSQTTPPNTTIEPATQ